MLTYSLEIIPSIPPDYVLQKDCSLYTLKLGLRIYEPTTLHFSENKLHNNLNQNKTNGKDSHLLRVDSPPQKTMFNAELDTVSTIYAHFPWFLNTNKKMSI